MGRGHLAPTLWNPAQGSKDIGAARGRGTKLQNANIKLKSEKWGRKGVVSGQESAFGRGHGGRKCCGEVQNANIKLKRKNGGFGGKNNPNFKYDITEDELYNLFIIQNKTVKEISSLYNCAINTINKKLRGFKIYKDKSNIYNLNKNNIITYLNSGLNYIQIGNKHGCSNKIIHKFIKKHKLYVK